jgi:DNA polymerase III delta prime subunit
MSNTQSVDWVERYRPTSLGELILPSELRRRLAIVTKNKGGISLLLYGRPGVGKTTFASLIRPECTLRVDCSLNGKIESIRNLMSACSTYGFTETEAGVGRRLVLLDEADYLSKEAFDAIRHLIEKFNVVNDFVLTTNHIHKIPEAIQSRCLPVHFNPEAYPELKFSLRNRLKEILRLENITEVSDSEVDRIVNNTFPDLRRAIKLLQFNFQKESEVIYETV